MNEAQQLSTLLRDVNRQRTKDFSGLGIIIYKDINEIPIAPLASIDRNIILPMARYDEVITFLVHASETNSKYHDGFHLLNEKFELTHIAQFVAPPIKKDMPIDLKYGSRYRTAIYASILFDVIACGVLSKNYPPTVFIKGEIYLLV